MAHSFRQRFGDVECELGVAPSPPAGFVAWALKVHPDGRLGPMYDRTGALVFVKAEDGDHALADVLRRVMSTLGPEQGTTTSST